MALYGLFNRTEGRPAEGPDWRDAAEKIPATEPPEGLVAKVASNLKKLPLDVAAKSAKRANDRLTTAEGELIRAEIALEQTRKENKEREDLQVSHVEKRARVVDEARADLGKAQMHFLREAQDCGALERTGPLIDLLNGLQRKQDEDIQTVRIESQ